MTINNVEFITLLQLQTGAKLFKAEYLDANNGKRYSFKDVIGLDLKENDFVVVESRTSYAVVKVVEVNIMPTDIGCDLASLKHAAAKLCLNDLEAIRKTEKDASYKLALSEVTSKLDNYRKQLGDGQFNEIAGLLDSDKKEDVVIEKDYATPPSNYRRMSIPTEDCIPEGYYAHMMKKVK